ncbi:hypothetical protein AVEN_181322-1 [Araneus ventricosus]|uniref:Uncharacterized protein n=1 Tax=Araneus ventricosus TaxID=182803 RepID=A0A4Y2UXH0_ARAVE|nr:hypothetical protein AVEN_92681-1 [Araneus ventricosus]GBO17715.1 hypothetical protein AVEN_181322-1 [Araneus ventricosus]
MIYFPKVRIHYAHAAADVAQDEWVHLTKWPTLSDSPKIINPLTAKRWQGAKRVYGILKNGATPSVERAVKETDGWWGKGHDRCYRSPPPVFANQRIGRIRGGNGFLQLEIFWPAKTGDSSVSYVKSSADVFHDFHP